MTDNKDAGEDAGANPATVTTTDGQGIQIGDDNAQDNTFLNNRTSITIYAGAPPQGSSVASSPATSHPTPEVVPRAADPSGTEPFPGPKVGGGPHTTPGMSVTPRPPSWRPHHTPAFAAIAVCAFVAIFVLVFAIIRVNAPTNNPNLTPKSNQSVDSTASASAVQPTTSTSESPSPSLVPSTPTDPLSGVSAGECFANNGTLQDPALELDPACSDGDFQVTQVLADTSDTSGCDGSTDDWPYVDDSSYQVVCFAYLSDSLLYHAQVGQCVSGPSEDLTAWIFDSSCQPSTFTVVNRYQGTANTSECGSDMPESLSVNDFPSLDVLLCLQMNYPTFGTAAIGSCVLETYNSPGINNYALVPCGEANAVIDSRTAGYGDPNDFCGTDGWNSWQASGYPQYSYTTCIRSTN